MMVEKFYQLCKESGFEGTAEVNVKLLSRHSTGARFTLRKKDYAVQLEVTDEELMYAGEKVYERIIDELVYRLNEGGL